MTQSILPLFKPTSTSRIVNVSSMVGKLNKYSPELTSAFRQARSVVQITNLMKSFQDSVGAGTHSKDGWPGSAYAVSKAGVTGMTRAIAAEQMSQGSKVLVNSCCPGYGEVPELIEVGVLTISSQVRTDRFNQRRWQEDT